MDTRPHPLPESLHLWELHAQRQAERSMRRAARRQSRVGRPRLLGVFARLAPPQAVRWARLAYVVGMLLGGPYSFGIGIAAYFGIGLWMRYVDADGDLGA